jgi:hypothetical protein
VPRKKRAAWVGPVNPAETDTGILKPTSELTAEGRAESEKVSPRPKVVPKDKKTTTERKIKKVDPKTGGTYEVAEHLREHKEPVQKRVAKKRAPMVLPTKKVNTDPESIDLGQPITQEVRAPKDRELKRGVTSVPTAPRKKRKKKVKVVPVPKPGQAGKLDGELVRVTPENATQIYEQRRRTTLPVAKEADMTPAGRPAVEPVILPSRLRGSQSGKNLGGFARPHKEVSSVAHEALDHLQTMAKNEPGTPLHHAAHEAFNVAHAQLGQISNNNFHRFMGMGRTIVTNHRDKDMDTALKVHRQGVLGKLEEGRIAEGSRGDRSGKGGNNGS